MRAHYLKDLGTLTLAADRNPALEQGREGGFEIVFKCGRRLLWHVLTETGTGTQDHIGDDTIGVIQIELHRDHSTDRIADQNCLVDFQGIEHGGYIASMFLNRITAAGFVRAAMTALVDYHHLVVTGEGEN